MAEGRIPPHNIDAEMAVIGTLLTTEDAYDVVSSIVKTEDFYRDAHRVIYEAIKSITTQHKRADLILLTEELNKNKELEHVGGIAYVSKLCDAAMGMYNLESYANIISEKAHLRRLIDAGNKIVGMCYDEKEETDAIVDRAERMVLEVAGVSHGSDNFSTIGDILVSSMARINEIQKYQGALTGIPSGFRDLDRITNGLQPSDLILVAARPSMGKTAFTLNIAQHAALKSQKCVAFFSLEMSQEQLVNRILSSVSQVSSNKLRTGQVHEQDWDSLVHAMQYLSETKLFIDDTPGLTATEMRSKLRRLKAEQGLDLVVVDYIQLMQGRAGSSSDNRQQEISEISRSLKLIARELNVPVIALSQLSRSVESRTDKRPVLSDLRESGSLEQDADIVMFLYRDKYYHEDSEKGDITEVLIRKHRNGELGTVELVFQGEFTRFKDIAYVEE